MSSINASHGEVVITRVENGWTVAAGTLSYRKDGYTASMHVARTPKELADMLADWATRQQDSKQENKG